MTAMIPSKTHRIHRIAMERDPETLASNLRMAASADEALRRANYDSLRHVSVTAIGGRLVLSGRLPRYHLKQVAQTIVRRLPGVTEVRNEIEVVAPR